MLTLSALLFIYFLLFFRLSILFIFFIPKNRRKKLLESMDFFWQTAMGKNYVSFVYAELLNILEQDTQVGIACHRKEKLINMRNKRGNAFNVFSFVTLNLRIFLRY